MRTFDEAVIEVVSDAVRLRAFDLATDQRDFDVGDLLDSLVECVMQHHPEVLSDLRTQRDAGLCNAAEECGEDPTDFQPCTTLRLSGDP